MYKFDAPFTYKQYIKLSSQCNALTLNNQTLNCFLTGLAEGFVEGKCGGQRPTEWLFCPGRDIFCGIVFNLNLRSGSP